MYEALEEVETKEVSIPISGMTCATCAKSMEKAVGKLEGVEPANMVIEKVDALTGATLRAGKIISAVRDSLNSGVYSY